MSGIAPTSEPIKVVFWDLDGTIWDGTLEEDAADMLAPHSGCVAAIIELDKRGILNSLVTQASQAAAEAALQAAGIGDLFVYSSFAVGSKAQAVSTALANMNLLAGNAAFVDDQAFHLAEVSTLLPGVLVLPATEAASLPAHSRCQVPAGLGENRRLMLQVEEKRASAAAQFIGSRQDFLKDCHMQMSCRVAAPTDMPRLQELLARSHRLSAGVSDLAEPMADISPGTYYLAVLTDRFGDYGIVAAALVEPALPEGEQMCTQLAISCRTQGRGVVEAFLHWLVRHYNGNLAMRVITTSTVNQPLRTALRLCGFARSAVGHSWEVLTLVKPQRLVVPAWIEIS